MKTLFEIGDRNVNAGVILSEWGNQYCLLAGYDRNDGKISWLTYKTFEVLDNTTVQQVLSDITTSDKIVVSSALPECLLTPLQYDTKESLVDLFPKALSSNLFSDTVNEWQLTNNYLIPVAIPDTLKHRFSEISYVHYFTTMLKDNNTVSTENQIVVQFAPNQFSVLVKKKSHLQLAQIYKYVTPLDVVYYLLKIAEAFSLSLDETDLFISGLIEEDSDLFTEINQYFKQVHFSTPSGETEVMENYPRHFFTSIYKLSTCVS